MAYIAYARLELGRSRYAPSRGHEASEIAYLKLLLDKLLLDKLQRMLFGAKSEKIVRQVEQLDLQLEELEAGRGEE